MGFTLAAESQEETLRASERQTLFIFLFAYTMMAMLSMMVLPSACILG